MATLTLNQITEKLNSMFQGEGRRLVFWYDAKAEFAEDIDRLQLQNAKLLKLEPHTQFQTKYFLERQDRKTNYLIYAPFAKPDVKENHLEDTLLYSQRFYADRASILTETLGVGEKFLPLLQKHSKFFNSTDRLDKFAALEQETYDEQTIALGMMCVLCGVRSLSFEDVLKVLFKADNEAGNKYLAEFDKYLLTEAFWKLCDTNFGYQAETLTLKDLCQHIFATYAKSFIKNNFPEEWDPFVLPKAGNAVAFTDSLMNNKKWEALYEKLSQEAAATLNANEILKAIPPEDLLQCEAFAQIDVIFLMWMRERLLNEDTGAKLNGFSMPEVCELRRKKHFGMQYYEEYSVLKNAFYLVEAAHYQSVGGFKDIIDRYCETDYNIDTQYRRFYIHFDQSKFKDAFASLRALVENIYTNEYLGKLLPQWNEGIQEANALFAIPLQRDFYNTFVKNVDERVVVIISDGMRYEVAQELLKALAENPKCHASLQPMLSTLPSYTRLGMSALLPHKSLTISEDGDELIDGKACYDLVSREKVLQAAEPASCAVQFDDVKNLSREGLRRIFTGKQFVYVYHDQIDNAGEHTEDEVFMACGKAIQELTEFIFRVSTSVNTYRFIVTADHGFIYKRDKVEESGKIGGVSGKRDIVKRRYIISKTPVQDIGICHMELGYLLSSYDDKRIVSFPCGASVFKVQGNSGQNYVHGGSSPQEMLVPVLDVKMERYHKETKTAKVNLVSILHKITSLETNLEFIQKEAVSETVKETTYKIYFVDEKNNRISNENVYVADNRNPDALARKFRLNFKFRNQQYDKTKPCYIVIFDENQLMEMFRMQVMMDILDMDDLFKVE